VLRLSGQGGVIAGRRVICVGTPNTRIGAGKLEDRVDYSDSLFDQLSDLRLVCEAAGPASGTSDWKAVPKGINTYLIRHVGTTMRGLDVTLFRHRFPT
jgi:hypothetical protein